VPEVCGNWHDVRSDAEGNVREVSDVVRQRSSSDVVSAAIRSRSFVHACAVDTLVVVVGGGETSQRDPIDSPVSTDRPMFICDPGASAITAIDQRTPASVAVRSISDPRGRSNLRPSIAARRSIGF
jgi:hypothetical protein